MGTEKKPKDGEKTESEACGTAPDSGWVFQTLDLMGSGFSERSLVRAVYGKGPGGTQLLAAAEEEYGTAQRHPGACWVRFLL